MEDFIFDLFDKRDSFPFSIVRMPDKPSNVPSSLVYSAIVPESLRIARTSNNPESFFQSNYNTYWPYYKFYFKFFEQISSRF